MDFIKFILIAVQLYWINGVSCEQLPHEDETFINFRNCLLLNGVQANKLVTRDTKSDRYNKLNRKWNLRLEPVHPRAYLLPTTAQDVADAVKCGVDAQISLIPNSGGHSYELISWGTDDQIVVDFRHMNKIQIEGEGREAVGYLEPGAINGQINAYLWEHGGYGLSMGDCLTIGIGGHVIGGGVGFFSGVYGLTTDNVLEVEVVDAQGNIVLANQNKNQDLFWAFRGSGPGYIGVLTRVKVKLFEASKAKFTLAQIKYSTKDFTHGFMAMQNFHTWLKKNDLDIGILGMMLSNEAFNQTIPAVERGMQIMGLHIQDQTYQPKGNEKFLEAIREIFPSPGVIEIAYPSYMDYMAQIAIGAVVLPHPRSGELTVFGHATDYYGDIPDESQVLSFLKLITKDVSARRYFKEKGFFTRRKFSLEELEPVQEVINRIPVENFWILVVAEQGQITKPARNETAYVHRDALFEINLHYEGSSDPTKVIPGTKYLQDLYESLKFLDSGETYQNTHDLEAVNNLDRYFKENLGRLIEIKTKWDPNNYFVSKLSIPISRKPRHEL